MKKGLRKWLLRLVIVLLLLVSGMWVFTFLNKDRIEALVVEQMNQILSTEVNVESIEFSLFRRFPDASILFRNIEIKEKVEGQSDKNFLAAKYLFLEFDALDLLTGNYTIDDIVVQDGELDIKVFEDGNNFSFVKTDSLTDNFQLLLQTVKVQRTRVQYTMVPRQSYLDVYANKMTLKGDFRSEDYNLSVQGEAQLSKVKIKSFNLGRPFPAEVDLKLHVTNHNRSFAIAKGRMKLALLVLNVTGFITTDDSGTDLDLAFSSEEARIKTFKDILPPQYHEKINNLKLSGLAKVQGEILGKMSSSTNASVDLNFELRKGTFEHKESGFSIDKIDISGNLNNGERRSMKTTSIKVPEMTFEGKHGQSKGSIEIFNLIDPIAELTLSTEIELSELRDLISRDSLEVLNGSCHLHFSAKSKLDSLNKIDINDWKTAEATGELRINNGEVKITGMTHSIQDIIVKAEFGKNSLMVDSLTFNYAGVSAKAGGVCENLVPYLILKDEMLIGEFNLFYDHLNLNKYVNEKGEQKEVDIPVLVPVLKNTYVDVNFRADTISYRNFNANSVNCTFSSDFPFVEVRDLALKTASGKVSGWAHVDVSDPRNIVLNGDFEVRNADITQVFDSFENFGQEAITSKNLKGKADASIKYSSVFNEKMVIDEKSIKAQSHFVVKNGELINYEPAKALSRFIEVEELEHIHFSTLTNDIEIRDRTVLIPEMDVQSSALALMIYGKHDFDNNFDYHMQLALTDLLFGKVKRRKKDESDFGEIEKDESGRTKIFVQMVGNIDDYDIKYDRRALRKKWKEDFKEEREELSDIFRTEFGRKKRKENKAEKVKIELEWEEFDQKTTVGDSLAEVSKSKIDKPDKARKGDKPNESRKEEKPTESRKEEKPSESRKKKWYEKLTEKNEEEEYEEYDPSKFD